MSLPMRMFLFDYFFQTVHDFTHVANTQCALLSPDCVLFLILIHSLVSVATFTCIEEASVLQRALTIPSEC
jgi:hypothetical protein